MLWTKRQFRQIIHLFQQKYFKDKDDVRREIQGVAVQAKSKYLGLLLVIGKSKTQVFKYIKEAAMRRISSWKNQFLSKTGREVLLKSVVTTPLYL